MIDISKLKYLKLQRELEKANDIIKNAPPLPKIECPKCGKTKPLHKYYPYNTEGNQVTYWCKDCIEHYIKHTSVGAN